MPCRAWKGAPTAVSSGVDISEVPGCHLLWQTSSQRGSQKLLQGLASHELTAYLSVIDLFLTHETAILSKGPIEWHNSLNLSFTNIRGLRLSFAECESFLESNAPDILVVCEKSFDDSINSCNFSVRSYLPLIRKDSVTHMHGLAVFLWKYLEKSVDSYICFWLALLYSVSYFFFLYRSSSLTLRTVFNNISFNIDEVLSINPSAIVFG